MHCETGYQPTESFIRVATACPEVAVGNVDVNVSRAAALYAHAAEQDASLVVFPEMSLTGYTIGDLLQQKVVQERAKQGLLYLAEQTADTQTAMAVGLPLAVGNSLYNCTAILSDGCVQGVVAKADLPNQGEFNEPRWFQAWEGENKEVTIGDQSVPIGTDLVFQVGPVLVGVEPCHALWVAEQPSVKLAEAGATLIINPSASPEQVTKSDYRRQLVAVQSGRLVMGYVYAGCDASESTMDIVMGGHQMIAENGHILAEREPLAIGQELTFADLDVDHLLNDRRKDTSFSNKRTVPVIDCAVAPEQTNTIRDFDPSPFVPKGPEAARHLSRILDIQAQGLASRLKNSGIEKVVLGWSGGRDSALALFVALRAAKRMGKDPADIIQTYTMPGKASSEQTQSGAVRMAAALGIPNEVIPIGELAHAQLKALGHDGATQDVTYENVQARTRTSILFNKGNQVGGLVLGTGDLSEIALGWCTFNGDHMSHYNVNASVPKTLVEHLVEHAAQEYDPEVRAMVQDILDTPISPELTSAVAGEISQHTEDLIGPYELHDFFLYYFVRWNDTPAKIRFMAEQAFADQYKPAEIKHWLTIFMQRFIHNQIKRSVAADGPKVGSVSLSPRGDWRMPSDMHDDLWTNAIQWAHGQLQPTASYR